MNDLMQNRENSINQFLQSLYYSDRCVYFYYVLLFMSLLLIIVTIVDGFIVAESFMFIVLEALINVLIVGDFVCRLRMAGTDKFFRSPSGNLKKWNIFDAIVVAACILTFLIALITKHGIVKEIDEGFEEFVMFVWAVQ